MKQKEPFSPERFLWKLICIALALILAWMLLATAGVRYLSRLMAPPEIPSPEPAPVGEQLTDFLNPSDINWQQLRSDITQANRETINLLLIGHDRREDEGLSRADAMILCTFRRSTGKLTMTSFLRDTWLAIPGCGEDRLNAAYAYGGAELLKQTLTENFEIPIDGCLEVDFSQFAQVIDTLGGVELTLRQDEADLINRNTGSSLSEGTQLLTGEQALTYSRIRKLDPDGDFSRTQRQRKVIAAVAGGYRETGIPTLMKLLKSVLPMLSTDLTQGQLLTMAMQIFPMLPELEITSQSVPAPGSCTDETINGMSVLVPDLNAARKVLHETTK